MNSRITFSLFTLFFLMTNCVEKDQLVYKYTNQPDTIKCSNTTVNIPLLKEALYSFEEDMTNHFAKNTGNRAQGYSIFINTISSGRALEPSKVSAHSRKIIEQLKKEEGLWVNTDGVYHLDYQSDLVKCLGDNIIDTNLQTTFRALLSTNSMSPKIFSAPLRTKIRNLQSNKFLSTYVALDLYYSSFMSVDFSTVEVPVTPENAVDNSDRKTPPSATPIRQPQQ